MLPGAKASSLVTMPVVGGDPYAALETALRNHVLGYFAGDPDRDIDGLLTYQDATGCLYTGTWQGHPRLLVGAAVDLNRVVDVMLIATKGSVPATPELFGKSGLGVGNSLLVARLLHVAAFALRAVDVRAIRNEPFDARVRRLYEDMGFQNGELLMLDDLQSLTTTFDYVKKAYQHPAVGGRLSLADRPLPL